MTTRLVARNSGPYRLSVWYFVAVLVAATLGSPCGTTAGEPPALNPFGPRRQEREDAVLGYVEMSDGQVFAGKIYMTRDKRLKIYDNSMKRQREVPLRVVKQIDCKVLREWMEKEWRFKELALNEKYFTGRKYPAREYIHTITLRDGRTITGPLAEIIYVDPVVDSAGGRPGSYRPDVEPMRFLLHKRDKGPIDTDLKSLKYVRLVKLGEEAYEEGKRKAARYRPAAKQAAKHSRRTGPASSSRR